MIFDMLDWDIQEYEDEDASVRTLLEDTKHAFL